MGERVCTREDKKKKPFISFFFDIDLNCRQHIVHICILNRRTAILAQIIHFQCDIGHRCACASCAFVCVYVVKTIAKYIIWSNYMETPGNESDSRLRSLHFKLWVCSRWCLILCQMHVRAYNTENASSAAAAAIHAFFSFTRMCTCAVCIAIVCVCVCIHHLYLHVCAGMLLFAVYSLVELGPRGFFVLRSSLGYIVGNELICIYREPRIWCFAIRNPPSTYFFFSFIFSVSFYWLLICSNGNGIVAKLMRILLLCKIPNNGFPNGAGKTQMHTEPNTTPIQTEQTITQLRWQDGKKIILSIDYENTVYDTIYTRFSEWTTKWSKKKHRRTHTRLRTKLTTNAARNEKT